MDKMIEALRAASIRAAGLTDQGCDRGVELLVTADGVTVHGWLVQWRGGPETQHLKRIVTWDDLASDGIADVLCDLLDDVLARLSRGEGEVLG